MFDVTATSNTNIYTPMVDIVTSNYFNVSSPTLNMSSTTLAASASTVNMSATTKTLTGATRLNLNGNISFGSFLKTQSVVATSRTFSTVYQNTKTTPLFVNVCLSAGTNGEDFAVYCDTNTMPLTEVARIQIYSHSSSIFFIVLPSYYYRVLRGTTGYIKMWCEWS